MLPACLRSGFLRSTDCNRMIPPTMELTDSRQEIELAPAGPGSGRGAVDLFTFLSREAEKTLRRSAGLSVPQLTYYGSRLAIPCLGTGPFRRRSLPAPLAAHSSPAVKPSPSSRRKKRRRGAPSCSAGEEVVSLPADVRAAASKPASSPATAPSPRLTAAPPMPSSLTPARCSEATPEELEERLRFFRRTSLMYSSPELMERIRQMEEDYGTAVRQFYFRPHPSTPGLQGAAAAAEQSTPGLQGAAAAAEQSTPGLQGAAAEQSTSGLQPAVELLEGPKGGLPPLPGPEHLLSFLWGVLTELKPDTHHDTLCDTPQPVSARPDTPQPVSARPDTPQPVSARPDTPQPDTPQPDTKSASAPAHATEGLGDVSALGLATEGLGDASAPGLATEGLCDASAPAHATEGLCDASAPGLGLGNSSAPGLATEGLGDASGPAHVTECLGDALAHATEGPADASASSQQGVAESLVVEVFKEQLVLILAPEPVDEGFEEEAPSDAGAGGFKERFVLVLAFEPRDEGSPGSASGSEGSPGSASGSEGSPGSASGSEGSPGSASASEGSPGSASASEGSPGSASASEGSPGSASASEVSPGIPGRPPELCACSGRPPGRPPELCACSGRPPGSLPELCACSGNLLVAT
ncbi:hypothetical protein CRENBAI_023915 [Crenichthys baileyi]|uniref:Uncharacterized protein n=1 Tax=Crenichthys baileyi TaxID=28760 RepID=A0AAV9SK42_9TELE